MVVEVDLNGGAYIILALLVGMIVSFVMGLIYGLTMEKEEEESKNEILD